VAVADVSACHQDTIGPLLKGFQHMMRGNPTGAHHSDRQHIGGVFQSHASRQIPGGITAPVTTESNDPGLECFFVGHGFPFQLLLVKYLIILPK
jgi:hypothetical protein